MKKSGILVTCPKGLGPYLRAEILSLGLPVITEGVSGIVTEGGIAEAMRLNLHLRTGHRVLLPLGDFIAKDAGELYKKLSIVRWEDYIFEDGRICVTSHVDNPTISDSRFANLKCKDAIVDRLREKSGVRPDSGPDRDSAVVYLYWKGKEASIYIDASGEPLSKRGYRKIPLKAPMQETLAAALLMAAGWGENINLRNFINPMCGSGTLAIEAALMAVGKAPGLLRENFGFMHVKGFDKAAWEKMKGEAESSCRKSFSGRIIATDISPEAVEAARLNADSAGVSGFIEFGVSDYADTPVPEGGGIIMLNPEYGVRLGEAGELEKTYKGIGDFFKHKCRGYTGYIFTGNPGLAKKIGLRPKRKIPFFNSNIECRLLEYELYEGSRKAR